MLALAVLIAVGCGESGSSGLADLDWDSEAGKVHGMVGVVSDAASNSASFLAMFAAGKAPPEAMRKKLAKASVVIQNVPNVKGTTADVQVLIEEQGRPSGPFTWQAVKVGDRWKLDSAPMQ